MAVDLSWFAYFAPIWVFLAVFVVMYALLGKTELIGKEKWLNLFVSFVIATIFISAGSVHQYVSTIVPWMAVLVISLFFLLLLIGFIGKDASWMHKGIGVAVIVLAVIIFVISGVKVFYSSLSPYIPGSYSYGLGADPDALIFSEWLFSGPIFGSIILLVISGIVSWILVRDKK